MDDKKDLELLIDSRRLGEDAVPEAERAELAELNERLAGDERAVELYGRIRNADLALAEALHDVPVPEGLSEQILASLKAARLGDALSFPEEVGGAPVNPASATMVAERGVAEKRVASRGKRPIWKVAAALGVAAVCLGLWIFYLRQPVQVTVAAVESGVDTAYEEELAQADPGWTDAETNSAALTALERFIHEDYHLVFRSRHLTVGGYSAVAHDLLGSSLDNLSPRDRQQFPKRVTLIVIERRVTGLDYWPSSEPRSTHGRCLSVWQSDRFVYALMVEGTEDQYRSVLRQHSGVT